MMLEILLGNNYSDLRSDEKAENSGKGLCFYDFIIFVPEIGIFWCFFVHQNL